MIENYDYIQEKKNTILAAVRKINKLFFDNKYSKYISFKGIKNTI